MWKLNARKFRLENPLKYNFEKKDLIKFLKKFNLISEWNECSNEKKLQAVVLSLERLAKIWFMIIYWNYRIHLDRFFILLFL